jgi:hypothetical protein
MDKNRLKKEYKTPKAFLGCFLIVFFSVATFMELSPLMQKYDTVPTQYGKVYKNRHPENEEATKMIKYLKMRAKIYKKLYAYNDKGERND